MSATLNPERRLIATDVHLLPALKPQGTRGDILEAALRLFAERGYADASVRDIAAACDIRAATVYSHYPSKGHILAELCRIGHEEHTRSIRAALLDSSDDPRTQIDAYVRAHVRLHTDFPMLAVVSNAELHMLSPALGARTFELRNQSVQLLQDIIERGCQRGDFNVPDTWMAAAAIGGMGLRVAYWFNPESGQDPDEVADTYAEFARRILNL